MTAIGNLDDQFASIDATCASLEACFHAFQKQVGDHAGNGRIGTARYVQVDAGQGFEMLFGSKRLRFCSDTRNMAGGLQGFLVCCEWKLARPSNAEWVQVLSIPYDVAGGIDRSRRANDGKEVRLGDEHDSRFIMIYCLTQAILKSPQ